LAFARCALRVPRLAFSVYRSSFIVHRSSFGAAWLFSFSLALVLFLLLFTPWGLPYFLLDQKVTKNQGFVEIAKNRRATLAENKRGCYSYPLLETVVH